jgi:hypothetical protein
MPRVRMKFNIAGVPKEIEVDDIDVTKIELDPENPRIGYWTDNQVREIFSQDEIAFALREKSEDMRRLKLSIETYGGATEPIWVCRRKGGRFLVIDGNTRVEIYKDLKKKYPHKETWRKIKCRILPANTDERAKNFIRLIAHLRGVNDWEVYERARMLFILWEKKGYTEEELQSSTKLSVGQIRKWIEAYNNMTQQFLPKFGFQSDALSKFSYFVEFENPRIKQGMEDNGLSVTDFCEWVGTGQITRAQDVRNLREIFKDKKATETLVKEGYAFAIERLSFARPGFSSKLFEHVEEVLQGLNNMTRIEEEEIVEGDAVQKKTLLRELYVSLGKIVNKFKN